METLKIEDNRKIIDVSGMDEVKDKYDLDLYDKLLAKDNYALITNIEREDIPAIAQYYGGFVRQYGGNEYVIKPTSKNYSANSSGFLYPHTDFNEKERTQLILGLYTVETDKYDEGGYTSVANTRHFLESIDTDTFDYLTKNEFCIISNKHLRQIENSHYVGPLLKYNSLMDFEFRFSYNFTMSLTDDKKWKVFRDQFLTWFNENKLSIKIPRGSLFLLNNHQAVHSRSEIYDQNRELIRYYFQGKYFG